mmetsp:Transcript_88414/g.253242  ORF Transcript_88414/g.253242 Transcript_88414/m.253242 type:complete len:207 (-) Transcript_88414:30-650(-)
MPRLCPTCRLARPPTAISICCRFTTHGQLLLLRSVCLPWRASARPRFCRFYRAPWMARGMWCWSPRYRSMRSRWRSRPMPRPRLFPTRMLPTRASRRLPTRGTFATFVVPSCHLAPRCWSALLVCFGFAGLAKLASRSSWMARLRFSVCAAVALWSRRLRMENAPLTDEMTNLCPALMLTNPRLAGCRKECQSSSHGHVFAGASLG